jgi:cyclophilin family peptidyl-prolyl cis-trans isomerase
MRLALYHSFAPVPRAATQRHRRIAACYPSAMIKLPGLCAALLPLAATAAAPTHLHFVTTLGNIDAQLLPDSAPKTVTNFLSYVNTGAYDDSVIHRLVANFVAQGGGFSADGIQLVAIPTAPAVTNEFKVSNTRGTIAMAKLATDPNSATDQFFFNLVDNSAILDPQNGGFTVFAQVTDAASLAVMDKIGAVPIFNIDNATFSQFPLANFTAGTTPQYSNLVLVDSVDAVLDPGSADFSLSAAPSQVTIAAGTKGSTTLTITPANGYQGTVNLVCGPLPAGATCIFAPNPVTFSGAATPQTVSLTLSGSPAQTALIAPRAQGPGSWFGRGGAGRLAAVLAGFLGMACVAVALLRRRRRAGFALAGGFLLVAAGCSSSPTSPGDATVPGTYNVVVRGSDGTVSHPLDLTWTVQ